LLFTASWCETSRRTERILKWHCESKCFILAVIDVDNSVGVLNSAYVGINDKVDLISSFLQEVDNDVYIEYEIDVVPTAKFYFNVTGAGAKNTERRIGSEAILMRISDLIATENFRTSADVCPSVDDADLKWDAAVTSKHVFAGETREDRIRSAFASAQFLSPDDLKHSSKSVQYHHQKGNYEYFSDNYAARDASGNIIEFIHGGSRWKTAQHAYQACKFLDADSRERIRGADTSTLKELAKELEKSGRLDETFQEAVGGVPNNVRTMFSILWSKFSQSRPLSLALLNTGWKPIMHRFESDMFWGCRVKGDTVIGENWNGKVLMVIREILRERRLREEDSWPPLKEALDDLSGSRETAGQALQDWTAGSWCPMTEAKLEQLLETGKAIAFDSIQERSGHRNDHAFLSDNFLRSLEYQGEEWRSVQHAYQAAKFSRADAAGREIRADIWLAETARQAKEAGTAGGLEESFEMALPFCYAKKLEVMFHILACKFLQNPDLAEKLLETGKSVIVKQYSADELGRTAGVEYWGIGVPKAGVYNGQNWSGRLLMAVRGLLRRKETALDRATRTDPCPALSSTGNRVKDLALDESRLRRNMARDVEMACLSLNQRSGGAIPNGAVIGGRYKVVGHLKTPESSFAGTYSYICEDMDPCAASLDRSVRETLYRSSECRSLREAISNVKLALCELLMGLRQEKSPADLWQRVRAERETVEKRIFLDNDPNATWAALSAKLRDLEARCDAPRETVAAILELEHLLSAPEGLLAPPRVFLKTFRRCAENRTVRPLLDEIRMCSLEQPELHDMEAYTARREWRSHPSLCGLSLASPAGVVEADMPGIGRVGFRARLPFVAMEHCAGPDLYDYMKSLTKIVKNLKDALYGEDRAKVGDGMVKDRALNKLLCAVANSELRGDYDAATIAALEECEVAAERRDAAIQVLRKHIFGPETGNEPEHWSAALARRIEEARVQPETYRKTPTPNLDLVRAVFVRAGKGLLRLHQVRSPRPISTSIPRFCTYNCFQRYFICFLLLLS
jgi:N-glycosidase YbiA